MSMSEKQYKAHCREGDGLCTLCGSISYGNAEPLAENLFCRECENSAVIGMQRALNLKLIEVKI